MLIANARPSTASGLAASSGLSVPRHTLASRCCLRHCRQRRYAAHRVRACQSVTGPHQAQDSQPETPDSRSRRSLQVTFTCDKCGSRTERLVNPHAWDKGLVYLQCKGCEVWHKLKDNQSLVEEIRLTET